MLKLPVKYRIVIHLYYFENYSTAEIATILHRKESTIRTQLKRARELLKVTIGGMEDE
ncbi:sigma factor-like helix-turn-helix DNA-binding protein [Paenibacillus sp. sgz500958]|uniref:sigma factor-like helix-turn-helix DNA-binding protein n=1 Tax=Paenibacillus sp. sgz500958 TaxID=3242475 RepID=UPI0036D2C4EA